MPARFGSRISSKRQPLTSKVVRISTILSQGTIGFWASPKRDGHLLYGTYRLLCLAVQILCLLTKTTLCIHANAAQQIVGRERRERVSQLTWGGEGCFDKHAPAARVQRLV